MQTLPQAALEAEARAVARFNSQASVVAAAAAEPLPGPAAGAFAVLPDIQAGPYHVRPFKDRDLLTLKALNHPVYAMVRAGIEGAQGKQVEFFPTGPEAWQLCWLFTRDERAVVQPMLKSPNGLQAIQDAAADEFGEYNMTQLGQVLAAVMEQLHRSWQPYVAHGAKVQEGEKRVNPPVTPV